jgi:hypothetical protein
MTSRCHGRPRHGAISKASAPPRLGLNAVTLIFLDIIIVIVLFFMLLSIIILIVIIIVIFYEMLLLLMMMIMMMMMLFDDDANYYCCCSDCDSDGRVIFILYDYDCDYNYD